MWALLMFQFTHPGGVRLASQALTFGASPCFNSRTREGCDSDKCIYVYASPAFQFTHPGGVRLL